MMSTRTAVGMAATAIAGLLIIGAFSNVIERAPSDIDLPPDPFESNEPRVVDCVARWNNYHGTKANFYCEVSIGPGEESISDYHDEDGIERSPFTWSTTASAGNSVYLDVELQGRWTGMDGACEVWVDGDTLIGSDEMDQDEEGVWFCRVEAVVP